MEVNNINVAVRVRPFHPERELPYLAGTSSQPVFLGDGNFAASPVKGAASSGIREVVEVMDHRQLDFDKPEPGTRTKRGMPGAKKYKDRRYVFDRVFNQEASQSMVFEHTVKPLLPGVLDGYNATVFAYGATGCGKTHTISGRPGQEGVIVRAMSHLFERFEEDRDTHDYYIELSFCEIYNEQIRDLLCNDKPPTGGLRLLENEKDRVSIQHITMKRPKSVEEVMELIMVGNARRSTSFTHANDESSRSHAVLQINVGRMGKGTEVDMAKQVVRQCVTSATLSIIDLAGSERAAASQNIGARQREGTNINKSLLALSGCIQALCQRPQNKHVPYRNSKLTRLLKFSLGGNCRTVMIVCVSPSSKDIDDTNNTLLWANRAKDVSTKVSRNTEGVAVRVQQYLDKIAYLQQRINELEAQISAGPKQIENPALIAKRERDRQELQQALDGLDVEVESHAQTIDAGAEKRAQWDVSLLIVRSLRRRMTELKADIGTRTAAMVKRDQEYLESRIKEEEAKFQENRIVYGVVNRESKSHNTIAHHIDNVRGMSLENLADSDRERLEVTLKHKKEEVDNKVYAARERGYRRMVLEHINKDATACLHIHSQKESLTVLANAMTSAGGSAAQFAEQIRSEIAKSVITLDTLHGQLMPIADALPPPVKFDNLQDFGLTMPPPTPMGKASTMPAFAPPMLPMSPLPAPTSLAPALDAGKLPQRSRLSLLPRASPPSSSASSSRSRMSLATSHMIESTSASLSSIKLPSGGESSRSPALKHPSVARLQDAGKPVSPRKRLSGSPAKRRFAPPKKSALASSNLPRTGPAKTTRWKGDDSMVEEKVMSDAQTMSSPEWGGANDSGSGEWDDVDDDGVDEHSPPAASVPAVKAIMGPPVRRVTIAPTASVRMFSTTPASSSPTTSMQPPPPTSSMAAPANDWKAYRQRTVHAAPSGLNTVSEEGAGPSSSPMAGNTSFSSRTGSSSAPNRSSRLSPLAESHDNPSVMPASTSTSTLGSSRLHKPTASSIARMSSIGGDSSFMSIAGSSRMNRRESGIGPQTSRTARRSIAPQPYGPKPDVSGSLSSSPSPDGTSGPEMSGRGGSGSGSAGGAGVGGASALSGGARRASINPAAASWMRETSMRAGPRESISTSASLRGLPPSLGAGALRSRASMANMSLARAPGEGNGLLPRASISNLRQSISGADQQPRWRG